MTRSIVPNQPTNQPTRLLLYSQAVSPGCPLGPKEILRKLRLSLGKVWGLFLKLSAASSSVFKPQSLTKSGKGKVCLQKFLMGGPLCNQTVLWGCAPQDSLISLKTSLGKKFSVNPAAFPLFVINGLQYRVGKMQMKSEMHVKYWHAIHLWEKYLSKHRLGRGSIKKTCLLSKSCA